MEKAIKKAIEGGWRKDKFVPEKGFTLHNIDYYSKWGSPEALIDRFFWQALGKAEGWYQPPAYLKIYKGKDTWWGHWHDFIDHLAEGKDAESFFTSLLKSNE